jgi:hypothetical protein
MAANISQWALDDCVKYVERMAISHKAQCHLKKLSWCYKTFEPNCICGSDMIRLGDSEWQELIPFIRFCTHIKAGISKIMEFYKREALSQLHRKVLPKKTKKQQF